MIPLVCLQIVPHGRAAHILCQPSRALCAAFIRQSNWSDSAFKDSSGDAVVVENDQSSVGGEALRPKDKEVHDQGPIFKLISSTNREGCNSGV